MLREGHCDAVLCAAGERCLDLMSYEGRSLGRYLADRPTSVLDGRVSGGDVPAEGAVVFVLKRLADARAAGNQIRGVIRGIGVGADRSAAAAVSHAIEAAHRDADIGTDLVRAGEVATAGGHDRCDAHLAAIGGAYGGREPAAVAGALDGLIGHAGAAAGAAGLLALTRALSAGALPASAALATPERRVHGLEAASVRLPIDAVDDGSYRAGGVTVAQDDQAGHVVVEGGRRAHLDDLAQHHASVAEITPHVTRLHLCGEPMIAHAIDCAHKAGHAQARIDRWDEALPWLLERLED
jgi:3-oxoacyl-(acyl-carrier-protein) synthase